MNATSIGEGTLSRGFDHLGEIAKTVGDLRGLSTVIHELIQNADDAPGATRMRFTVRDDALEVWNDGVFSRCSDIATPVCDELASRGHRCDFHSFRSMGSGDKRNRPGTTGAFGIGFTSVYQITDRPELISNGEHWAIDEMAPEERRISRRAAPPHHEGTTFRLPWATDHSLFRSAIRQPPVTDESISAASRSRHEESRRRSPARSTGPASGSSRQPASNGGGSFFEGTFPSERQSSRPVIRNRSNRRAPPPSPSPSPSTMKTSKACSTPHCRPRNAPTFPC
jgi:hypothetical protein